MSRFGPARPLLAMALPTGWQGRDGPAAPLRARQGPGPGGPGEGGPGRRLMNSAALCGDRVLNRRGELLGTVSELLLDVERGCIAYVVMAYGGFMGLGERLYALPWRALELDADRACLTLDAERSTFDTAPAFDKDHWPTTPDAQWHRDVHRHYGSLPYWE